MVFLKHLNFPRNEYLKYSVGPENQQKHKNMEMIFHLALLQYLKC